MTVPSEIRIDGFVARRKALSRLDGDLVYDVRCPCGSACCVVLEIRIPARSVASVTAHDQVAERLQNLITLHDERLKGKRGTK